MKIKYTPTPLFTERIASAGFSQMEPQIEYEDHILEPINALIERCQIGKSTGVTKKIVRAVNAHEELLEALYQALPYVEDQLQDEGYKPGAVEQKVKFIKQAIAKASA